jgi:diguanylate cyclase (GGDEF)-like protein/PAS domain S-box-containing protein
MLSLLIAAVEEYAILMLDPGGHVMTWNSGAQRINGYRREEIVGRHFSVFYPPEDVAAGAPQGKLKTVTLAGHLDYEGWRIRKDGTRFWANILITAVRDARGRLRGYGKITRDLTERHMAALALQASEDRFRLTIEAVQDYAILTLDVAGNVATWNLGAERSKGYTADEIIGRHFSVFYQPTERDAGKPERDLSIALEKGFFEDEGWRVRKDGTTYWALTSITAVLDNDGVLRGYTKISRDLTERVRYERLLENIADHDPLTGVMNRRGFEREMAGHIARGERYGPAGAVLMIDLDNFKLLNDACGHSAGDELLVRVAHALQSRLRGSDVVARLGGDEFAVLLPVADEEASSKIAEALLTVVREEAASLTSTLTKNVTASVGLTLFSDGENVRTDAMLANADHAM